MSDHLEYDIEPETDDDEAAEAYAAEVKAAVEGFNVPVLTPPTARPAPQDYVKIPGKGRFE